MKITGRTHYLWRAVDHQGEVLVAVVTKRRNKKAALKFLKKLMKRYPIAIKKVQPSASGIRAFASLTARSDGARAHQDA